MVESRTRFFRVSALVVPAVAMAVLLWLASVVRLGLLRDLPDDAWQTAWIDGALTGSLVLVGSVIAFQLFAWIFLDNILPKALRKPVPKIARDLAAMLFAAMGLTLAVGLLFQEAFSGFLAISGIIGVVVGLALRPIILDIFSGLSTNMEAAFHIDDFISVEGTAGSYTGWVDQINWRTTHIRTRAGDLIVVPNSHLSISVVTNHSRPYPETRYHLYVRIDPEYPVD